MTEFDSLTKALEGHFEKLLCDLPKELRERFNRDYPFPHLWDDLTPDQRRAATEGWDHENDPNKEADRQYWYDLPPRKRALEDQKDEWERAEGTTVDQLTHKEDRLTQLGKELALIERQEREGRIDVPEIGLGHDEEQQADADSRTIAELLDTVTAKTTSNVQATQEMYDAMARTLYQEMAENPEDKKSYCAVTVAKQLTRSLGVKITDANVLRRTGAIDKELLDKLRCKFESEQAN